MPYSLTRLFLMKISSKHVLVLVIVAKFSMMPVLVRKLNLAPNILSFDFGLDIIAFIIQENPLSLILL